LFDIKYIKVTKGRDVVPRIRLIILWGLGFILLILLIVRPAPKQLFVFSQWTLPLAEYTIVIDPGHGGVDGGAVGADGTSEKEITLAVAQKIQHYLQHAGANVFLTREEDVDLASENTKGFSRRKSEDIRNRLQFIHEKEADLFLTIHLNAMPSTVWRGAQTFYYPKFPESEFLAKVIQAEIIEHLQNTTREALPLKSIYLLKYAEIPGALVELGFLSNETERDLLKDDAYQDKMAASIYDGILRYLTEDVE